MTDWKSVYAASRPHVLRGARNRALGVLGIAAFILSIWSLTVSLGLVYLGVCAFLALIVGAFIRQAIRQGRRLPRVLVGKVVQKGWAPFRDSGGPGDGAATRYGVSPRITLRVDEAFDLAADGTRHPRPEEHTEHVIEQLRWFRALNEGDDVTLVCLPDTIDPVYQVPPPKAVH